MNPDTTAGLKTTIDVSGASATTWDLLVIGAGPGGAFTALEAARAGLATLLVERFPFPRAKVCGGCLNQSAVEALHRAGLGQALAGLGGRQITAVRLRQARRQAVIQVPPGVAVSRGRLDAMLARAAVSAGAGFLPETTAILARESEEDTHSGYRTVDLYAHSLRVGRLRARVVVAADGLAQSSLRACGEFESLVTGASRIGIGALVPAGILDLPPETITMAIGRAGYAGAVMVEEGRVNVAAALDPRYVKQCGSPGRSVASLLEGAGLQAAGFLDDLDWQGTIPLTRRTRRPVGHRVLLVGDAAGYVEPFTGEGMAWALALAGATTPLVQRGLDAWDASLERDWITACRALTGRRQQACRMLTRALRAPWAVRWAIGLLGHWPSLAQPMVSRLGAGRSRKSAIGETR